jgi:transcriptional regulator with XRE-family HTH domain
MNIGERLRKRRLSLDLTLEEVAQKLGVSRQTVSRYETGVVKNIPEDRIRNLAVILKTTRAYLLGIINDPDRNVYTLQDYEDSFNDLKAGLRQADQRLVDAAHEICFDTPSAINKAFGLGGSLTVERMQIITDFVKDSKKTISTLILAKEK